MVKPNQHRAIAYEGSQAMLKKEANILVDYQWLDVVQDGIAALTF
jgi:hypothetical protein